MAIRSPIIVTVGHVDHGKTTLLDKIRGTAVTKLEPGQLSQHVGASYIPIETVKKISQNLLDRLKTELTIPGLLLLDTPGHAAFIGMRKRGGNISDLAILVIDITEGFQEQTDESLTLLKEFKTPFVVAATKIDKIAGWFHHTNSDFLESFQKQSEDVKGDLEKRVYQLVGQLAERGFNADRFDRVEDFTKQVTVVPVSGISGEGIPDLLMILAGLSQQFLKKRLEVGKIGRGSILEVKETKGFGLTLDVILYDGSIRRGDFLVIGSKEPIITKIKALLRPRPLQELRVEKQFDSLNEVFAAAGIKIAAPNLENVIAGSPLIAVEKEGELEEARKILQKEVEEVQFVRDIEGIVLKADTLGSLEAMIKLLHEIKVPIRKAEVGNVSKQDLVELQNVKEDIRKVVLAFNVKVLDEVKDLAKDFGIEVFENNVIYKLIDEYKEWSFKRKEREIQQKLQSVNRPCQLKILKGFVFRVSNPAIFGVEVQKGILRSGVLLRREDGKIIGKVKEVQKEGQNIPEAKSGDRVAISMEEPTIGRQIKEGDVLISELTDYDLKILREMKERLNADERELLNI